MGPVHSDPILRLADGVSPSVHYVDDKDMPSAVQQATTVANWAWIILNSEFQKDLDRVRAMVFVPSLQEAQTLQAKIQAEKPEWVVSYLPVDAHDNLIDTINTDFRNVVVLMLPYLGLRFPIRRINQVLCPDTVQITLFEATGERKEIRQVPLEWIDFLSSYACPHQSPCRVFFNFERGPDELERRQLEELERPTQGKGAPKEPTGDTTVEETQDGKSQADLRDMPKDTLEQTRKRHTRHNPQDKKRQKIRVIGTKQSRVQERRRAKPIVHTQEGVQLPKSTLRDAIMQDCFRHWEMSLISLGQSVIDAPNNERVQSATGRESLSSSILATQDRRDKIWSERQTPLSINGHGNENGNENSNCDRNGSRDGTASYIAALSEANPSNLPTSNTYVVTDPLTNETEDEQIQYIGTQPRYNNPAFQVPNTRHGRENLLE